MEQQRKTYKQGRWWDRGMMYGPLLKTEIRPVLEYENGQRLNIFADWIKFTHSPFSARFQLEYNILESWIYD